MPKRKRVADEHRFALDGTTRVRNIRTPEGSSVGTQTLKETPNKRHKAWQYNESPGATPAEAAMRHKDNTQSIRDARKKAAKEDATGQPTRRSLHDRAGDLDRGGGLLVGDSYGFDDRKKKRKAFSEQIRRAEQPIDEKDAQNAVQRASDQVLIHDCIVRCTCFMIPRPQAHSPTYLPTLFYRWSRRYGQQTTM
jgi:hypothetical protein